MIPLSDDVHSRRFPAVTWALIAVNVAVWLFYEVPDPEGALRGAFYPCEVVNTCDPAGPWGTSWLTAMFLHASWDHLLGNMVFLGVFGGNVEDAYGHLRYLVFYLAGGFVATATQTAMTLAAGSTADAAVPNVGASGAIAAVLGAYVVLYPKARVRGLFGIFPARVTAWVYLGVWFVYQFVLANFGLYSADSDGGVAFFAHVGGFVFGFLLTLALHARGRVMTSAEVVPGASTSRLWNSGMRHRRSRF
jgi:membrane associated rhomboid family serine protease